jgi:hypothetical protein
MSLLDCSVRFEHTGDRHFYWPFDVDGAFGSTLGCVARGVNLRTHTRAIDA